MAIADISRESSQENPCQGGIGVMHFAQMKAAMIQSIMTVLVLLSQARMPLQAAIVSNFDNGDEGWRWTGLLDAGNPPPTNNTIHAVSWGASAGNPGGGIGFFEQPGTDDCFVAPAKFLGNQSASFHGTLSFDEITNRGIVEPTYPLVWLIGNGMSLYYQGDQSAAEWLHHVVPLQEGGWWKVTSSTAIVPATDAELLGVLSNLTTLYLQGDWTELTDEASRLDNVALGITYPAWADRHGLTGQDALPNSCPAHDGIQNLLKCLLGLDPQVAITSPTNGSAPGLPVLTVSPEGTLQYMFLYDRSVTDLVWRVEESTDLAAWTSVTAGISETQLPGSMVRVVVTVPATVRKFLRLEVSQN